MLNKFYDKFIFTNALKFKQYNFFLLDIPFFIVPIDVFVSIVEKNDMELNKDLYYSIKESTFSHLIKRLEEEFEFKEDKFLEFFFNFFSASGWGLIKLIDFDKENFRAIVSVQNSPFAMQLKNSKFPVDHFLRGILAAIFSASYNTKVDCVEISCQAQGKNHCEFILKKPKDFHQTRQETKKQLRL